MTGSEDRFVPLDNVGEWKSEVLGALRRTLDRRSFMRRGLQALGGALMAGTLLRLFSGSHVLAAPPASAKKAVETGTFFFPRLKFDVLQGRAVWDVYPIADVHLRRQLTKLTNINASEEPVVVSLDDFEGLRHYPFVFATDQQHFKFSDKEEANLREFLLRGGFIYGDDCVLGHDGILFFQDFRNMMNKIYPDNPMRRVPDDHELYHGYFDFPKGLPFLQGQDIGSWATFDRNTGRILTLLTPTDLHCGWTGSFFTPEQNLASLKMGINIIVYYLSH
ncbi:MAG TPA: DUF4159 domain-containing protein [Planctomycetota bacterium]|nr:DUF4159 domain-containing protein [Planctomycetota bacterium]